MPPAQGRALEIACGTAQHVVWFAQTLAQWTWQPTEIDQEALAGIDERVMQKGLGTTVLPASELDVLKEPWFADASTPTVFELIYCCNMLQIAPWQACAALMRGSARYRAKVGVLINDDPYFEDAVEPAQSNLAFDQTLRATHPDRGIRLLQDVEREAAHAGLCLSARHAMPANNLLLVWWHSMA